MPLSKRAKARRRKQREADDVRLETLADWIEEYMPARSPSDLVQVRKSEEAWDLACDLMPVIKRMWQIPAAAAEETPHEGE